MRRVFLFFIAFIFYTAECSALMLTSFSDNVEKSMPAVVNISTTQKASKRKQSVDVENPYDIFRDLLEREFGLSPYGGRDDHGRKSVSLGSGFIVDPSGYIITNNHVIEDADEVNVTLSGENGQSYTAKIVGKDPKTDVAVLKIDAGIKLPFLKFGDSDAAKVGDVILVIGNPFGLGGSVSAGIISAKARNINSGHFDDFIQTDAAINVGNSGGPMLNIDNDVVGMNSAILSPSKGNIGIGFAIPSNMIQHVFMQLKENGKIVRGQLGITIQEIDKGIADGLGLNGVKGALVSGILKGSPAEKSNIQIGDVIVKFNNKPINSSTQLPRMVGEVAIGAKVELDVIRDGKNIKVYAVIETAQDVDADVVDEDAKIAKDKSVFGMQVQALDKKLVAKFGIKNRNRGVVVVGVDHGSLAALIGIRPGDVIVSVNKKDVSSLKEFEAATSDIKKSAKASAAFLIARGDSTFFVSLEDN